MHIRTPVSRSVHLKDVQAERVLTESSHPPPTLHFDTDRTGLCSVVSPLTYEVKW